MSKLNIPIRYTICSIVCLFIFNSAYADDPGITKVRLIQQTDTSYIFEADVPQMILSSIKKPILPERFTHTDFELNTQSGWITLKTIISTSGSPFNKDDEILLPWLRNGVDFTAQWKGGKTYKGLFNRSLEGIHIPLAELMPTSKSTKEILAEGLGLGLSHVKFKLIHLLFILSLAWILGSAKHLMTLLWWSLGQGIAMILAEFGIPGVGILFSDMLILAITFSIAYTIAYKKEFKYLWLSLFIAGLIHGLAFTTETQSLGYTGIQKIQAQFAFISVIDLVQIALAFAMILIIPFVRKILTDKSFAILTGGFSIMLILLVFSENVSTRETQFLTDKKSNNKSIRLPAPASQSMQQMQRGTGLMTAPIMAYLSVEPYEIRQEVLINTKDIIKSYYPHFAGESISLEIQDKLKTYLTDTINNSAKILIDGQSIQSAETSANFVRLSRGGVTLREAPVIESLYDGIIGIILIYDIPSFPNSIEYEWTYYPGSVQNIEASIVDPYGTLTANLSSQEKTISWKNRLSGFELSTVEPIVIEQYPLPIAAICLWILVLIYFTFILIIKQQIRSKPIVISLFAIGFIVYPFLRTESELPFLPKWKPSTERSANILNDLLANVYRAFDRRKENDVYDRLSLSVTGEQLTEIYLSNRQAMALENRGGARANVDEVDIIEIYAVNHAQENGFTTDASWIVRGSVNHFGHTHYRQNQYRALVTFIDDQDVWKISSIETIEEKRIY